MFKKLITSLLFLLAPSMVLALDDLCGDKWNNLANAHVFGACPVGYIDSMTLVGCDKLCTGLDADGDGYATTGLMPWASGRSLGSDCDDADPRVFPGKPTIKGCPVGQFKTCQDSGTFTACAPLSDFGNTSCTARYYIDPIAGNNANPGTYASPWADQRMFSTNDVNPGGHHVPVPGDCFIYKTGGVNSTTGTVSATPVGIHLQGRNCSMAQPCRIMALPGVVPIFDYPGTSVVPTNPIYSLNSDYWYIEDLLYTGNYCDANGFTTDGGCAYISSDNVTLVNLVGIVNNGNKGSNLGGLITHSTTDVVVINSVFGDNYDSAISGENNTNFTDFRSVNLKVFNTTAYYSVPAAAVGAGFKQKHSNVNSSVLFRGTTVQGALWAAFEIAGPNHTIDRSLVSESNVAYVNAELGGPSYMIGSKVFENNTILKTRFVEIRPHKAWNLNGSAAVDSCSGDPVLTNWNISKNVVVDSAAAYPQDSELVTLHNYGPDVFYTDTITGNKMLFSNGCVYNTLATPLVYSVFRSNNGDLSCTGRGNLGTVHNTFLAWQGAGFDTGTINLNPLLDASSRATLAGCSARGYRQLGDIGTPAGGGGGGGSVSNYIRRVIRSFF